jgi:beta-galactosidase
VRATATLLFLLVVTSALGQRSRERFDDGWKFKLETAASKSLASIRKWNWLSSNLKPGSQPTYQDFQRESGSEWKTTTAGEDNFHGRIGFSWYRATLPASKISKPILDFSAADDNAWVFLNGKLVFKQIGYGEEFEVKTSGAWIPNEANEVVVAVENTAGPGSLSEVALVEESAGKSFAEVDPTLGDSGWRNVQIPHDFVLEGSPDPTAEGNRGFLPTGLGWYRKTFQIPAKDKGKRIWIDFDGVFRNVTVWLNGKELGHQDSGYAPFQLDITDALRYGSKNVLAVRCDARKAEGWWYEGGGIYRHVWLNKASPIHITPWGLYVHSKKSKELVSVMSEAELTNQSKYPLKVDIEFTIQDAKNAKVATGLVAGSELQANETKIVKAETILGPRAHLWSLENPYLYHCICRVTNGSMTLDTQRTPFGIRFIRFDAQRGFLLNGKPVKIKGTCNHQDVAGVGTALPDRLFDWRVQKLLEMGSNAYRCSHNMVADALLDACDRRGMLVMDENRHLGDAKSGKTASGTPLGDLTDLKTMIKRDRNHPSVILWSMCNEEGLEYTEEGAALFKGMKDTVYALDSTRPVTAAMNGGWGVGFTRYMDVMGVNYAPSIYDDFHHKFPDQPMMGSETASEVGTRGEYVNDSKKGYVSAYGRNAPSWAQPAEVAWKAIAERDFVAGGFVWTGFDYRGEPTPYSWPCVNSHFGVLDLCGFPKDTYWYYQAWWKGVPTLHILPHWNWPFSDIGKEKEVWVQTNADSVELFLNGKSIGVKPGVRYGHVEFKVPYYPGKLEAIGFTGSRATMHEVVSTTDQPASIRLIPYWSKAIADREDEFLAEVQVLDPKGRVVPTADNEIEFEAKGAAQVWGVGNGDPSSHEASLGNRRRAFHGLALVVLKVGAKPGPVTLSARSKGLRGDAVTLKVSPLP